uniref:2,3-bisphosphoglycerate-independent phosphoglycerate mutase n=1 Tax=Wrangelia sp. TaxID=2575620 RepID=A0A4D6WZI6_9FLOR|nr:Phosphoglycerate mutase [Wrangelia sp.]
MHDKPIHPIILTILDGWGYSEKIKGNAIKLANTPTMDKIWQYYPHTLLKASGEDVGLPKNQMGNSEVGHTTIGAGRIINQDLVRIEKAIQKQEFFKNPIINNLCQITLQKASKLHLIGLCSNGGVHSHIKHLKSILDIIKQYKNTTCIHIITDGRDTAPKIAIQFIQEIEEYIINEPYMKISTISGRYYSMDRDCRWSRTEKTYKVLTENENNANNLNSIDIIKHFYSQDISDEFIPPTRISTGEISNNDSIFFFNFRPDRIRQLVHCFTKTNFKGFDVKKIDNLNCITLTNYDNTLNIPVVFPPAQNHNFLGQIVSNHGFKQLRLAETEKYAHVTYFFNGGKEEPFPGEDRKLIPSPKIETYDLEPEMSAYQITETIIQAINSNIYKLIIVNYANPDMVGHTGNLKATIKAIEVIDTCIKQLINTIEKQKGTLIITADHGNADYMLDNKEEPCKSHSLNPVPLILINYKETKSFTYKLRNQGCLADIAPTILDLLNIKVPQEMNGQSLLINPRLQILNDITH